MFTNLKSFLGFLRMVFNMLNMMLPPSCFTAGTRSSVGFPLLDALYAKQNCIDLISIDLIRPANLLLRVSNMPLDAFESMSYGNWL